MLHALLFWGPARGQWFSLDIMDDTWSLCTLGQFTFHWCGYTKWPLYLENKKRLRKEADHSRSVDVRVNKRGNLHRRLAIGGCKRSQSPYLPISILRAYIKAFTGFSHIYHPDAHTHEYLKAVSLGQLPGVGRASRKHIPRARMSLRIFQLPGFSLRIKSESSVLLTSPKNYTTTNLILQYIVLIHFLWSMIFAVQKQEQKSWESV